MIAIFPKIAGCAASGDVERLAVLVRDYYAGEEKFAPQIDLGGLTQRAGISLSSQTIDGRGAILVSDHRGAFQVHIVLHKDVIATEERNFLLANLLGHFFIDLQPLIARGDTKINGIKEFHSPLQRFIQSGDKAPDGSDGLCDHFAASLLLPRGMLKRAYEKIQDSGRLASFFGTSPQLINRRLAQLGTRDGELERQNEPANFFVAEATLAGKPGATAMPHTSPQDKKPASDNGERVHDQNSKMDRIRQLAMALEKGRHNAAKDKR